MAKYTIIEDRHPYYRLQVEFGSEAFEQETLFSQSTKTARETAMQAYADSYEAAYVPSADQAG